MTGLELIAALLGGATVVLGATIMVVGMVRMVSRRALPAAIDTFMLGSGVAFLGAAVLIAAMTIDNVGWLGIAVAVIVALMGVRQLITAAALGRRN